MILFVADDPGAKNHIMPLFEHVQAQGQATRFIDLAAAQHCEPADAIPNQPVRLLVSGWSVNQAEWPWVLAARHHGIKSGTIIDVGIGQRMQNFSAAAGPDQYVVTNDSTKWQLVARGVPRARVAVTGNPYLEWLLESNKSLMDSDSVRCQYGCREHMPLLSVFLPDYGAPKGSLEYLHSLLEQSGLASWRLVIRPHPRDPQRGCPHETRSNLELGDTVWNWENRVSTPALLAASICSLTFGSTVSAESLALGTPSAYFQIGSSYEELERLYANHSAVPRLRCTREFFDFISCAINNAGTRTKILVETYLGATKHAWAELQPLMLDGKYL